MRIVLKDLVAIVDQNTEGCLRLRKADPDDLSRLVGFLYARRHRVGKRPRIPAADEHFFKEADRLLVGEFSHALNISPDDVWTFVDKKIRKVEKTS